MGEPKLLKLAGGKTIFEITLGRHLLSSLDRITAVVPGWVEGFGPVMERSGSDRVAFAVMDRPCRMSDSLKSGWRHLTGQGTFDGIMISLADQPLVRPGTIDAIIRACTGSPKPVCVPVYQGKSGRPVILSPELGAEVLRLEGDEGARSLLRTHAGGIERVPVDSDEILWDFDRPEDLGHLAGRLKSDSVKSG